MNYQIPNFVEIEFSLPFYELYYPTLDEDCNIDPRELRILSEFLTIKVDFDLVYRTYENTKVKEGDVFVFFAKNDRNIFIYLDLFKDEFDQVDMVRFGVRINTNDLQSVRSMLNDLYFKSSVKSDIQEDYFNQSLWRIVNNKTPKMIRQIRKMNVE